MNDDITVCIPTIPSRGDLLVRAVKSVSAQTLGAAALSIAVDVHKQGAGATRQRTIDSVMTPWIAFLDDDDEFQPQHLRTLYDAAIAHNADYVYSWFETAPAGQDPFPITHFTRPWDNASPRQTTITILVRTELARDVGFNDTPVSNVFSGEDWFFTLGCIDAGAKIHHVVERTWTWHHHGGNTSGLPIKGDAVGRVVTGSRRRRRR